MNPLRISIFYAREDYQAMLDVAAYLHAANPENDVWHDQKIPLLENWPEIIAEKLHAGTDVAILIVSEHYFNSPFVQNIEAPINKIREKNSKLLCIPILVGPLEKLTVMQRTTALGPKKEGNVVAFSTLISEEKLNFLKEQLSRAIGPPVPPPDRCGQIHRFDLRGEVGQEHAASKLAADYRTCPGTCIQNAVRGYLKNLSQKRDGASLASAWGKKLAGSFKDLQGLQDADRDILTFLEKGPPKCPVHLENFSRIDLSFELLMNPEMVTLLNGLRVMESSYLEAESLIKKREHKDCALAHCALGQCYRKKDKLGLAKRKLLRAEELAARMGDFCGCGLKCPKASILAEVHRGLGTVFRKEGQFRDATDQFGLALTACESENITPDQKAGVHYSYGYFLLESGVSCWDGSQGGLEAIDRIMKEGFSVHTTPSDPARTRLLEASKHFSKSHELNPDSGPALSRRAIIGQLLGNEGFLDDFIAGADLTTGPESPLTRFFCEVGLVLYKHSQRRWLDPHHINSQAQKLVDHFLGPKEVSEGPRQCHAFDLQLVLSGRGLDEIDRNLDRAAKLLINSATWQRFHTIDEQHRRTKEFLDGYDGKVNG